MEKYPATSHHKRIPHCKDSTKVIERKLQKRRELEDHRRERHREESEVCRVKKLEEQQSKPYKDKMYFTKAMEKDRRSWILGMGNASPTSESSQASPKIDSRRQRYNRAMRKLENTGRLSAESESSQSSSSPDHSHTGHLPYERHSAIYHSSQFQVSDLVRREGSIKNSEIGPGSAFCRICQSNEDCLRNQLVTPCSCTGSLQYVHNLCLQQWRKTKRASGADISKCELCLKSYDIELLGETDVKPDQSRKMQEDLRRLVRSGVYLMLLVDFCRDSFQELLNDRKTATDLISSTEIAIHPSHAATTSTTISSSNRVYTARDEEDTNSSEDNEEYISRAQVKQRSQNMKNRR